MPSSARLRGVGISQSWQPFTTSSRLGHCFRFWGANVLCILSGTILAFVRGPGTIPEYTNRQRCSGVYLLESRSTWHISDAECALSIPCLHHWHQLRVEVDLGLRPLPSPVTMFYNPLYKTLPPPCYSAAYLCEASVFSLPNTLKF